VAYVASYAVFLPSLFVLMGRRFPWRDVGGHVDALLIAVAPAVALWMVFLDESFHPAWTLASAVSLAYPIADTACLAVMIRIALLPGRRSPSFWLLFGSLVPLLVADGSYVVPALASTFTAGHWFDIGWLGSYLLLGTAALHPSMRAIATQGAERFSLPVRRVVLGGLALLTLPLAEAWESLVKDQHDTALFVGGGSVVIVGMVVRAIVLVRDLDRERRRAEESERLFRMVFERAPIGISVGREGMMSRTNPALQRMVGYTGVELARCHYSEITHPDDRTLTVQLELDEGRRDSFSVDKRLVTKDGQVVDARVHVALDVEDGIGIGLIEEATERRRLEEELRRAQRLEAIGKLAGGVAHDFNNLMTAVLGYSELVLKRLDPHDVNREKLEAIHESALRASDLTRQLLAFGRRQVLQPADVDLREVVARLDGLLRSLLGDDIRLQVFPADEPAVVRADATQLEQVVMNLAVNARDAMPGGGTLTITTSLEDGAAVLVVSDTGSGIDEATLDRVFEPFFTTKEVGEGTGLGLSTVHGIVGQSGGTVEVESALGVGSVFTVRLPLAAREPVAELLVPGL
jgi:PAS domain S-box-containing protein